MDMFTTPSPSSLPKAAMVEGSQEVSTSFHTLYSCMDLLSLPLLSIFRVWPWRKSQSSGKAEAVDTVQRSSRTTVLWPWQDLLPLIPDSFHLFATELKGKVLLVSPVHFEILWRPLTLGGDCFHYHINDDDSPSAANPSTARRGQAEVKARQLLKQNGEARGSCSSCSEMPQESRAQQVESLV